MKQHGRAPQLRPRNLRKTVVRMFSYFKYNKLLFVGGLILIVLGSLARIGANGMLSPIIDSLVTEQSQALFVKNLVVMGLIVITISIAEYLGNLFMARLAQRTIHQIRTEMFSHVQKLPMSFLIATAMAN